MKSAFPRVITSFPHHCTMLSVVAAWAHDCVMSVVASDSGRRNYKGSDHPLDSISQYILVAEQDEGEQQVDQKI